MQTLFTEEAWEDYLWFQANDKAALRRVNDLIKAIKRDPFAGIGKPEPLKHNLSGFWSRRITDVHRLVYTVDSDTISIVMCRYHY